MADEIYNEVTNRLHSVRESESPKTNHIVSGADEVYDDVAPYRTNGHIDCTTITPVGTENPVELRWYERVNNGTEQSPQYEWIRSQDTTVDAQKTYGIPNGAKQSDINDQLYGLVADIDKVVLYANEYEQVTPQQGDNPQANGWYELSGSTYVLTTDTTVVSGKNYYVRIAHISPDESKITNQEDGYIPTAGAVGRALGANFEDNLTSTSTVKGLTANQGRVLNEKKANKDGWYEQFVAGASLSVIGDTKDTHAQFFYRETGDSSNTGGTNYSIDKGTATIDVIKGNTLKWNQLVQNGDFSNGIAGWSSRVSNCLSVVDGKLKILNVEETSNNTAYTACKITSGHKYFIKVGSVATNTTFEVRLNFVVIGSWGTRQTVISSLIETNKAIVLANASYTGIVIVNISDTLDNYSLVDNVQLFDLTEMFGADNEPSTPAEFEAWLTNNVGYKDYYDYTEGSLISLKPKKLISTGFNLWDEEWEVGDMSQGQPTSGSNRIRSKNYCKCFPNTTYYSKTSYGLHIWLYDSEKNWIGQDITTINTTFTTPSNAAYFKISTYPNYGNTYNHDICINLSDTNLNGTYKPHNPYMPSEVDLSWIMDIPDPNDNTKKLFPYGLLSAGSVRDEITATKAIKRIGSVDMGDLTWKKTTRGINTIFEAKVTGGVPVGIHDSLGNAICWKYTTVTNYNVGTSGADKIMAVGSYWTSGCNAYIKDSTYSSDTAEAFKTAMSGVMLYYELETPIKVTFEEPNTHPMNYEVEPGGTEEFVKADVASGEKEPTSTSLTANIIYPLDSLQAIRNLQTSVSTLSTNLATLKSYYRNSINSLVSAINQAIEGTITSVENPADSGNYTFTYTAPASTSSVENESI